MRVLAQPMALLCKHKGQAPSNMAHLRLLSLGTARWAMRHFSERPDPFAARPHQVLFASRPAVAPSKYDILVKAETTLEECMMVVRGAPLNDPCRLRGIELSMGRLWSSCRQFEQHCDSMDDIQEARVGVRKILQPFVEDGPAGRELTRWPRGPGSSTAMRLAYEGINLPSVESKSHYAEWYMRNLDMAHGLRSRKDTLRGLLSSELIHQAKLDGSITTAEPIRVLDLANGPVQSLKELLLAGQIPPSVLAKMEYSGYDKDGITQEHNRQWMKEYLDHFEDSEEGARFQFYAGNAIKDPFQSGTGNNNIVYSTGFFDYLPDDLLKGLWKKCYASLKPGGALMISLKDANRYDAQVYHYLFEWDQFLQRTEDHFLGLFEDVGMVPESCTRDATGIMLFYTIRKPL